MTRPTLTVTEVRVTPLDGDGNPSGPSLRLRPRKPPYGGVWLGPWMLRVSHHFGPQFIREYLHPSGGPPMWAAVPVSPRRTTPLRAAR